MNDLDRLVLEKAEFSIWRTLEVPGVQKRDTLMRGRMMPVREEYKFEVRGEPGDWTVTAIPGYFNQPSKPDDLETATAVSARTSARDAAYEVAENLPQSNPELLKRNYQRGLDFEAQEKQRAVERRERLEREREAKAEAERLERRKRVENGEVEMVTGFQCPDCEHIFEEEPETDPHYVCGNCGNEWNRSETDSHRCEQCGKFAGKENETSCPECQSGVDEFEEVECIEDGGELVTV